MKEDLLKLIDDIPHIESLFRRSAEIEGLCIPSGEFIYDNPDYLVWKQQLVFELQEIFSRTSDSYIGNLISQNGPIERINGKQFDERKPFNELVASLKVIERNIDKYYTNKRESEETKVKQTMFFISHSSNDEDFVKPLVDFLADIGLDNSNLFCSSFPDYDIPLGKDIYDYLASLYREYNLHIIYMLSANYYSSPVCLNEMGAAWVLKNDYTSILLPKFEYKDIKGAVNPNTIGFKYDDSEELLKSRLGELKNIVLGKINKSIPDIRWETKRNEFIKAIKMLTD